MESKIFLVLASLTLAVVLSAQESNAQGIPGAGFGNSASFGGYNSGLGGYGAYPYGYGAYPYGYGAYPYGYGYQQPSPYIVVSGVQCRQYQRTIPTPNYYNNGFYQNQGYGPGSYNAFPGYNNGYNQGYGLGSYNAYPADPVYGNGFNNGLNQYPAPFPFY